MDQTGQTVVSLDRRRGKARQCGVLERMFPGFVRIHLSKFNHLDGGPLLDWHHGQFDVGGEHGEGREIAGEALADGGGVVERSAGDGDGAGGGDLSRAFVDEFDDGGGAVGGEGGCVRVDRCAAGPGSESRTTCGVGHEVEGDLGF